LLITSKSNVTILLNYLIHLSVFTNGNSGKT